MKHLNDLLELDRKAITELCAQRVPTNGIFDTHPAVQTNSKGELGLLGILNYFFSYEENGKRLYVRAVYGADGLIQEFLRY